MDPTDRFAGRGIRLDRIYTRTGDHGETGLAGGRRVRKDALRVDCYGTVDELNAVIGMARVTAGGDPRLELLAAMLERIQQELFNLGSQLATEPERMREGQPGVTGADVDRLEKEIDQMNRELEPLRSFVLPGGCRLSAELHLARTVCRRAERRLAALAAEEGVAGDPLPYLNRLSDALFVQSRWASRKLGAAESLWEPGQDPVTP